MRIQGLAEVRPADPPAGRRRPAVSPTESVKTNGQDASLLLILSRDNIRPHGLLEKADLVRFTGATLEAGPNRLHLGLIEEQDAPRIRSLRSVKVEFA